MKKRPTLLPSPLRGCQIHTAEGGNLLKESEGARPSDGNVALIWHYTSRSNQGFYSSSQRKCIRPTVSPATRMTPTVRDRSPLCAIILNVSNRLFRRKTTATLRQDTGMNATIERSAGKCLVKISGRITIDSSPDLRILLLECLESSNCKSLTVDFSGVVYVDTSAVAILLEALRAALARKKTFQLTGLRERARYLLEATRLLHLFDQVANERPT